MLMSHRKTILLGVAYGVMLLGLPGSAAAQSFPYGLPPLIPDEPFTVYDHSNVPDSQGCVKQCVRDQSPCDPPAYKRADNRCRSVD